MIKTVCSEKITARKMHRCDSCGSMIVPRDEYWRFFCVDNGRGYTWKEHTSCRKAARIIWDNWSHFEYEFPVISEVDDEDVASVILEDKGLALLVFGPKRVKQVQEDVIWLKGS